ncbi:MAG TPA: DoxX family protein [Myxococcota bacterium]|nr:DoxX family protein [Myxococcota bacterium]
MAAFMRPFESQVYAIFRIVIGLMFMIHGAQKLFGLPVPMQAEMGPLLYAAGAIEFVGGLLVMIGLFTTWAAFICSGQMAVAYWMAHGLRFMSREGPGWPALFPHVNLGELAVLYCFVFLFISARGAGIWSVDATRAR